ncbi:PRC-barrel domain-containing protein [Rufibacter tibetensis]|uniref:PRC-barrel domain-containing protein n=1 Tax=Rufibacter tibetensis TaxID=512763 RepID=UPI00078135DE|nr:PRC-barrel domain-containing protein [Rufibacter tibetensis]
MANNTNDGLARLAPLHDLKDFKVANNNMDVRGWEVIGSDGKRIGKVDDLIVDRELMKVRYLDIDVDKEHVLVDTDPRHILIPIGAAQLDDDSDQVFVGLDQMALARFPFYKGGAVDSDYEYRVMHAITSPTDTYKQQSQASTQQEVSTPNAEFYGREHFNEDRFYGNRHQRNQPLSHDQGNFQNTGSHANMNTDPDYNSDSRGYNSNQGMGSNMGSNMGSTMSGGPVQDDIATIERLRAMLEEGTITQEEFTALKRKAIGL